MSIIQKKSLSISSNIINTKIKMSKIQSILTQLQQNKIPDSLPELSHVFETDLDLLSSALKRQKDDKAYYAILKYLVSEVKRKLGYRDYTIPLMQISLNQLKDKKFINDLKLKICQAVIDCQQFHRAIFIQNLINQLTQQQQSLDSFLRARLQITRAGKQFLKGDFIKASIFYLNASRQQAIVLKNEQKKLQLINKAIAFSYISPINKESHKNICVLCLNQLSKFSPLKGILDKLFMEDIFTVDDCQLLLKYLPASITQTRSHFINEDENISIFKKSTFSHNMLIIFNSFKNISFNSICVLLGMGIDQILILLELTYQNNEILIDQEEELIEFRKNGNDGKEKVKEFFNQIDEIVGGLNDSK